LIYEDSLLGNLCLIFHQPLQFKHLILDVLRLILKDNIERAWVQIVKLLQNLRNEFHPPFAEVYSFQIVLKLRQIFFGHFLLPFAIVLQLDKFSFHFLIQLELMVFKFLLLKKLLLNSFPYTKLIMFSDRAL